MKYTIAALIILGLSATAYAIHTNNVLEDRLTIKKEIVASSKTSYREFLKVTGYDVIEASQLYTSQFYKN